MWVEPEKVVTVLLPLSQFLSSTRPLTSGNFDPVFLTEKNSGQAINVRPTRIDSFP